jgi:hypothetical protein
MDVESSSPTPTPLSQNSREGCHSELLPYLQTFFTFLSHPCLMDLETIFPKKIVKGPPT